MARTGLLKTISLLLILIFMAGAFCSVPVSVYADMETEHIKQLNDASNNGSMEGAETLYQKKQAFKRDKNAQAKQMKAAMDFYEVPMEKCSWVSHPTAGILNGMTNMVFGISKQLVRESGKFISFSMNYDLFDQIGKSFNKIFSKFGKMLSINNKGTGMFISIGIALTLGIAAMGLVRKNTSSVISSIGKVILIMLCGTLFFVAPIKILGAANDMTKTLGGTILEAASDKKSSTMEGITVSKVGERANTLVCKVGIDYPWQELAFGEIYTGKQSAYEKLDKKTAEMGEVESPGKNPCKSVIATLNTPAGKREGEIDDEWTKQFGSLKAETGVQGTNVGTSIMVLLIDIAVAGIIAILAMLLLATQMLALLLAMVGVAVLIMAFFPSYGFNIIKKWGMNLLTCFIIQIVVYFILCILLVILDFVYSSLIVELGILATGLFVIALIVMFIIFKGQIMGLFGGDGTAGTLIGSATGTSHKVYDVAKGSVRAGVNRHRHKETLSAIRGSGGGQTSDSRRTFRGQQSDGIESPSEERKAKGKPETRVERGKAGQGAGGAYASATTSRRENRRQRENNRRQLQADIRRNAVSEAQDNYLKRRAEIEQAHRNGEINDKEMRKSLRAARKERMNTETELSDGTFEVSPGKRLQNRTEKAGIRRQMEQNIELENRWNDVQERTREVKDERVDWNEFKEQNKVVKKRKKRKFR